MSGPAQSEAISPRALRLRTEREGENPAGPASGYLLVLPSAPPPGNTTYARDLSVSFNKLADLAVAAGQG